MIGYCKSEGEKKMKKYEYMLSPMTVKNVTFKNRVLAAPITTNRIVIDGIPTQEGIDAFETKARGGFASVTLTESFVDFEYAARHEHGIDIVRPHMTTYHIEAVRTLVEAIQAHGAIASIQLNHVGHVNHPDEIKDHKNPIGPSAFVREDGVWVEEMDEEMMDRVADNYANAYLSAKAFGFDMVMLHGGHGWLLSQFISPLSNHRTDKYGGSLENRARFPKMVLDRVRKAVGDDFLIEYRVSGDERIEGGMNLEETIEYCKLIQDKVDMIHVTAGIYHSHVETKAFSSMFDPHGCNLELAEAIKKAVNVPVVAVGGFNSPDQIEAAIAEGKCDFAAVGRQQFADPDFVKKTMEGREDEIAPCLRCSCFNPLAADPNKRSFPELWHCAVNPMASRELRWRQAPLPERRKTVLVIGGGVGGMYAAITAAKRGHDVTLCEKAGKLGGLLWFTDSDEHKESLRRYKDSLIVRCQRSGVKVQLNTEVIPELIERMNPDHVICAVGSSSITPPIPGIEYAKKALEVYKMPEQIGKKIIIIGGGLIGCEIGFYLADIEKKEVHILEMREDLAIDANDSHRRALIPRMKKSMTWDCSVKVTEVLKKGVKFVDGAGKEQFMEADTVLYAVGMKANSEIVEELKKASGAFRAIGDCKCARQVKQATYEGFCAAMDII